MNIAWLEFSWEAFATLVTGLAAVIAATYVAINQIKIQTRQTKLIENDLKIQLLEKRSECIEEMRMISDAWIQKNRLSNDEWARFWKLLNKSEILFPEKVIKQIDESVSTISRVNLSYFRSSMFYERGKNDLGEKHLQMAFEEEDKIMPMIPKILDELIKYTRIDAWE